MHLSTNVHFHDNDEVKAEVSSTEGGPFAVVRIRSADGSYTHVVLMFDNVEQIATLAGALHDAARMLAEASAQVLVASLTPDQAEKALADLVEKLASGEAVMTQEQAAALWPEGAVLATTCMSEGCDEPPHGGSVFCAACLQKLYAQIPF